MSVAQNCNCTKFSNILTKQLVIKHNLNQLYFFAAKYLMKCDDDTFVNIPNLVHVLMGGTIPVYNNTIKEYDQETVKVISSKNRLHQFTNLLLGSRFCNSKPISNISSKWYNGQTIHLL